MSGYEQLFRRLDELGTVSRGRSKHRPRNDPILYGGPHPFIQTGDVKHANFYVDSYSQTYSDKGLAQSKLWPAGTLCITIAANIAETAVLKFPACFPDSIIGFTAKDGVACTAFVKYCLDTYKTQMQSISQGTTQDNMSQGKLLSLKFRIPDFQTQQKIAAILSAYDDLIANNQRRIALLERMAEDIYREWFVRLRFPGHEQIRIEKGVPQGWTISSLGDVLELCYGKALKDEARLPGDIPVYGSGGVVGTHSAALVEGPGIVVGRKGNVGSIFWSDIAFFPIDTVYYVRSDVSLHFLVFLLRSMNFINNDAAVPGLSRQQAYANELLLPPEELINQFTAEVKSLFEMRRVLSAQIEQLQATRNALLPRLISGQLAVDGLDIRYPPGMAANQGRAEQSPVRTEPVEVLGK